MLVERAVTLTHVDQELASLAPVARERRWGLIWRPEELKLLVTMFAHNGDPYIVQFTCDDYKALPPIIDFIDPLSFELGTARATPKGTDSFFHSPGVLCAPFNRKAYKCFYQSGPHADWPLDASWLASRANGTDWSNFSTLGDIIGAMDTRIRDPNLYKGRMGE